MSKLKFQENWLVSIPADTDFEASRQNFSKKISKVKPEAIYTFHMPYLTVTTLDNLVVALDEMTLLETASEGVVNRLASTIVELLEGERMGRELLENSFNADGLVLKDYLIYFNWDVTKYPIRQSVTNLSPLIKKQINQIEQDLSMKMKGYGSVMSLLSSTLKRKSGSFATKYLGDFVTRDDFILDSEVLRTLVVAVPLAMKDSWSKKYEHLDESIVPRSSRLINEDAEFSLFAVTLLKENVRKFTASAKKNGFLPREDFDYNEEEICEFNRSRQILHLERIKMFEPLLKWLRMSFSEAYIAYVHVKACRVFVESVIRYGLPEDFGDLIVQLVIIERKKVKNMKDVLKRMYNSLDPAFGVGKKKNHPSEAVGDKEDYFPVVLSRIRVNLFEILNV